MRKHGENGLLSVMKLTYEHLQGCVGGKLDGQKGNRSVCTRNKHREIT